MIEHDSTGALWATDEEKEIRWKITTIPAQIVRKPVWCEQLEKDRHAMCKILGAIHAQTWTLNLELRNAALRTDDLFRNGHKPT